MKIELPDIELDVPDSMTDAQAQAIVNALVTGKIAAATAVASATAAQDQVAALLARPSGAASNADVVAALGRVQQVLEAGFARMFAAQMADTVLVDDGLRDEPNIARKVIK